MFAGAAADGASSTGRGGRRARRRSRAPARPRAGTRRARCVRSPRALGVAEPAPQLGAARIAVAAIPRRVPRGERAAQPAGGGLVVAGGDRVVRARRRRRRRADSCGDQRARRQHVRARDRRRRRTLPRPPPSSSLLHARRRERREPLAGLAALERCAALRCSASSLRSDAPLQRVLATRDQQRSARAGSPSTSSARSPSASNRRRRVAGSVGRGGLALEALGGAHHVAALDRELGERVPRGRAARIERTAAS